MAKLKESVKLSLKSTIIIPYSKKITEKNNKLQDCIIGFQLQLFPEELTKVYENYPLLFIRRYTPICVGNVHNNKFIELINKYRTIVPNNTITNIDSLYTSNYIEDIKDNILNSILNSENTNKEGVKYKDICLELLEELLKAMLEYDTLNKKLMCVFGSINTEKQLKDEFPEAYALYIKEFKPEMVNNKSDNKCDAIEEVRALINNSNKDE